jgi:hypothetical protein
MTKGSLTGNTNWAVMPTCPRLAIASTGFITGSENVIVCVPVLPPPVNDTSPLAVGGGLPTVPPLNVLSGPHTKPATFPGNNTLPE